MTTYNTGNPVPSTDPRDLYDNAENLDTAMHSPLPTWVDRKGTTRTTWSGATGYQILGDYAAGLEFTSYNQVFRYLGEFYRPAASTNLPYTTTGTIGTDLPFFVSVGDAVLRGDLAASDGTTHIGRGGGTLEDALDDIEDELAAIPSTVTARYATKAAFDAGKETGLNARNMEGTTASGDGTGGMFFLRAGDSVSPNDGIRSITRTAGGRWRSVNFQQGAEIPLPAGFPFTPLVKIIKTNRGYRGDIDMRDLAPSPVGVTYYVDNITGSDAAAGTAVAPLKSVQVALMKSDVAVVKVAPSFYHRLEGWASAFPAGKDFIVERWEGVRQGPVILSTAEAGLSWTPNGTHAHVYQANRTLVVAVRDYARRGNEWGMYRYRNAGSLAAVAATKGTWWTDGTVVYVNTLEGGAPNPEVKVVMNTSCGFFNTPNTVYVEGIEFHGGREGFFAQNSSTAGGKVIMKNCRFLFGADGTNGNGLRLEGVHECYLQGCEASYNTRDGFNYHESGPTGERPYVLEIDCRAFYNGQEGNSDGINNASTMHDGGAIIRVGGEYAYSEGPNVVDVGASQTFNVGVCAHDSRVGAIDISNANFYTSEGNLWLYDCEGYGSYYDAIQTGAGVVHACLTPLRRTNVAQTFYVQPTGDILA